MLKEAKQTIGEWQENVTEPTIALRRKIGDAKTMDDMADLIGEARGKQFFDAFRATMADFRAEETGLMEQRQANNESTVSTTYLIIGISIAAALLIGLLLAWAIGNAIANPIKQMTIVMQRLAGGDTSAEVPGTERDRRDRRDGRRGSRSSRTTPSRRYAWPRSRRRPRSAPKRRSARPS